MDMLVKIEGDNCVISVQGARIDAAVALEFKEDMRQHTVDVPQRVILDLTQVMFIDSSGLGAIIAAMKHLAPERKLVLAGLTPPVEKVFKLTRMDSVFDMFLTLEAALQVERV